MKRVLFALFIFSICFVSSVYESTIFNGADSYSKTQNEISYYNISINKGETSSNTNITQIEITLPTNFTYEISSQGTTTLATDFTKTGTKLIWENLANTFINLTDKGFFWFKASASAVGEYEIIIVVKGTGSDQSTIPVNVTPADIIICNSNWTCSEWSECLNSVQTRNCTDNHNCNNQSNKPIESQSCSTPCTSNWTCSEWSKCVDSIQTKTCTDSNNCDTAQEKPITTKNCIKDYNWLFVVTISAIILMIIGIGIYLILTLKKSTINHPSQPNEKLIN